MQGLGYLTTKGNEGWLTFESLRSNKHRSFMIPFKLLRTLKRPDTNLCNQKPGILYVK